ncbi:hypothetical protein LEP1GSC132_4510 [Leptospira kirschneri str. 200803703]|uniref:hypothetical protein n=1 Tax=Leptospira kirschneri TaxID=29507 RepID=UPI0002BF91FB|nr:hypothetical protein [Leptospira kirschneri]EMO68033.1 hypothetical protein LEP1GSC132_4510 [Leptospira kirschneri str. 200803703]
MGSVCPPATLEPWVANNALMGDLVHPNAIVLTVWGYHVSSKIKSVGWDLPKNPPITPPLPPPTDNGGRIQEEQNLDLYLIGT